MQKNCNNRIKGSKAQVQCEQCNLLFIAKRGSMGRFCSLACKHELVKHDKVNGKSSYMNCCKCHAALGFGIVKSSQFVGKAKGSILRGLKSAGVVRYFPEGGSWQVSAAILRRKEKAWQDDWMSEYNPKFPDWWSVYAKDRQNKLAIEYQRAMHHSLPKEHPWRLKKVCRTRIYHAIKRGNAGVKPRLAKRTTQLIGCSMEYLREYLESKFQRGMTWENHGSGWHIDHIVPCAAFDFTQPDQILQCFHYTNLQPLWAHENLIKSDRIITTQMNLRI